MSAVALASIWTLSIIKVVAVCSTFFCLLLGLVVLFGGLGAALKIIILRLGPKYLKAPLKVDSVSLGLRNLTIYGLEIGGLEGFQSPQTIGWKTLTVTVHQYRPAPVLLTVELQGYDVTYESAGEKSNLQTLVANVSGPPAPTKPDEKPPAPAPEKPAAATTVVLKRLHLTGGKALVHSAGLKLDLPDVEMTDLGAAEGGLKAEEITPILLNLLLKTVVGGLARAGFALAEGVITDVSQTASNLLGGLLGAVQSSPLPDNGLKQELAGDLIEAQQEVAAAVAEASGELKDAKQNVAKIEAGLAQQAGTVQQTAGEAQAQLDAVAHEAEEQINVAAEEAERVKAALQHQADEVAKKFKSFF